MLGTDDKFASSKNEAPLSYELIKKYPVAMEDFGRGKQRDGGREAEEEEEGKKE